MPSTAARAMVHMSVECVSCSHSWRAHIPVTVRQAGIEGDALVKCPVCGVQQLAEVVSYAVARELQA